MTDLLKGKVVKVGIADMNMIRPPHSIRTSGLGSCVGVVIYDEKKGIAGLAHVMLPDSSLAKSGQINVAKFADTAVKELVHLLVKEGARMPFLKAKLAGGAQMFQFASGGDLMRIGPRNVDAVRKELSELHIHIIAEDVGGNSGRTIQFNLDDCLLNIRTVNKGTKNI
ncbi:chemotaxis protein CheD [Peribacillus muralis]|uniref:chemotaxis protein CheD n=1 Tax=Peribacillus muralis TaxID=264697 RepID=UPI001F4DB637|nr:chemotaxis protein CheD [Peribacillus muralis]MCK1992455.1 chemotaxis protein CheD [Peribacillus muralis]MCK2013011.1 chemotaxis protein CheD [Peribacillus muralis]